MPTTYHPEQASLTTLQWMALLTLGLIVLQFLWAGLALFGGLQSWGLHKASGFSVLIPVIYVLVRSKTPPARAGLRNAAWTVALLYIIQVVLAATSKTSDLGWLKVAHLANAPLLLLASARLYQRTLLPH